MGIRQKLYWYLDSPYISRQYLRDKEPARCVAVCIFVHNMSTQTNDFISSEAALNDRSFQPLFPEGLARTLRRPGQILENIPPPEEKPVRKNIVGRLSLFCKDVW